MMCAMVKKAVVGTALGAGALFLVFGTSAPSYVKTAFHKVRHGVKGAVPPQFEIERARQAIDDLKPMFDQNKETLARAEIEVENLEKEVATIQANLDRAQKTIVSLRDSIKTGDIRLAGHVKDAESRAKAELAHRLEHFRYTSDLLKQKNDVLQAKQKTIMGAHEQLQTLKSQKGAARGPIGQDRNQAPVDRDHPVEERFQLRQQCPVSRQEDRLGAGRVAGRDGAEG